MVLGADAQAIAEGVELPVDEVIINGKLGSWATEFHSERTGEFTCGADGMLLCLIDHPLISSELVSELVERFMSRVSRLLPVYIKGGAGIR